jgi:hypothetical protein
VGTPQKAYHAFLGAIYKEGTAKDASTARSRTFGLGLSLKPDISGGTSSSWVIMIGPEIFNFSGGFPIQTLFTRVPIYERYAKFAEGHIVASLVAIHGRGWYGQLLERYLSLSKFVLSYLPQNNSVAKKEKVWKLSLVRMLPKTIS